jgi:hypothetical protein
MAPRLFSEGKRAIGAAIAFAIACSGGSGTAPTTPSTPSTPNTPNTPAPPVPASLQVQSVASTVLTGAVLSPQPVVRILDVSGAIITTGAGATLVVTAARGAGTGSLGGTTSVTAVAGVATFTNLTLTGAGSHTLQFTTASPALNVTSTAIDVTTPAPPPPAIVLNVGAAATATVAAGQQIAIPLLVDMTNRGTANVASLTVNLSWDPARFVYVDNTAGSWIDAGGSSATVIVNTSSTQAGTLPITGFTVRGTTSSFTVRTVTLRAIAAGAATVSATVPTAGNEAGGPVTVTPRNLSVTITP